MRRAYLYNSSLNLSFNSKNIKLCIVGAGRSGEFHVKSLAINKQYDLLYIIDINKSRAHELSNKAKCLFHYNLEWILENVEFDGIIICTTTSTHYDLTIKCLNAGKHVFCEKPLGKTEKEIRECFNLANSLNLKLLIAYQKRFDKNYNKLYEILTNNNYKPKNIHITNRDFPMPPLEYLKTSNGIVEDMICHDIDIVNLYMNFEIPEKVIAFTYTYNDLLKSINEIEGIEIMLQYKNGEIVNFSGSRISNNGYDQRVELSGSFGQYTLNNQTDDTIIKYDTNGSYNSKNNYSFANRYCDAYVKELDYFYKMINEDYPPLVHEEHLILTKKICNAINESINKNKLINMRDAPLRTYEVNTKQYYLYKDMHINQTLEFVKKKREQYAELNNIKMKMCEALKQLNNFVDPSDPDLDKENIIHAYQTAERIRILHPLNKELQITGLIHDIGKILYIFNEPNWAVVGDTYVLGCEFPDTIIYYDTLKENNDFDKYDKNGIYENGCGLDNLFLSFGHDEYLYQVLMQNNTHKITKKNMDIIRYHSFYPWHSFESYRHFMRENDYITLENVQYFNKFDLYSKEDTDFVLTDEIQKYYDELLCEYFPEELLW